MHRGGNPQALLVPGCPIAACIRQLLLHRRDKLVSGLGDVRLEGCQCLLNPCRVRFEVLHSAQNLRMVLVSGAWLPRTSWAWLSWERGELWETGSGVLNRR